jgi:hypothetical protein
MPLAAEHSCRGDPRAIELPWMSSGTILSYASPGGPVRPPPVMLWLVSTSILFCVCEWLTEYGCQQAYLQHQHLTLSGYKLSKAQDNLIYDMVMETGIALVAALLFFVGQAGAYPWRQARVRAVWPLVMVMGVLVSLMGWGTWLYNIGEIITAAVRLVCALLLGVLVSSIRRVAKG